MSSDCSEISDETKEFMMNLSRASRKNYTQNSEFLERLNETGRRSSQITNQNESPINVSSEKDSDAVEPNVPKVRIPPRLKSSNNVLETTTEPQMSTFNKQRKRFKKDFNQEQPPEVSLTSANMQAAVPGTPTAKQSSPLVFGHES